jgi:GT2 family glycosyltransferase
MKSVFDSDSRRFHFSVIVPTRRRPTQLAQCLQALAALDYPRDAYEIIVVHDGEPAREPGPSARGLSAGAVVFVNQPSGGPATARNTGANCATGTYLVFTDDDCAPAPDWLKRLERYFDKSPESAIGGLTVNALAAVPYSAASQLLVDYLYEYYQVARTGRRFFTTNNFAVLARGFRELNGFDESFPFAGGEDREFCERWQRSGREILFAEDVRVYHSHHLDFRSFFRQHFNYGRGADFLHRSRARQAVNAQLSKLEPASFYFNLVRFPLTRGLGWRAVPLCGLMCVSQFAYGTGYFAERVRQAWRSRIRRQPTAAAGTRIDPADRVTSDRSPREKSAFNPFRPK